MKIYCNYLKMHIKALAQYKMSFVLSLLAQIVVFFSYYFIILALFSKFDNIKGFTMYEVLLCFSIIQMGFAVIECFARGMDKFDKLIMDGSFDRILLRPRNIILQVIGYDIDYVKLARIIQAVIIMVIALINLNISWNIVKVICLLLMIISAILIFFGLFTVSASYCFLTVQGLEIRNVFTDGGKHMAQYPIGVFKKGFVVFFTFIVPYAFVNYYPLLYLLGKKTNIIWAFSPLVLVLFVIPCIYIFYKGTKKYTSVGS